VDRIAAIHQPNYLPYLGYFYKIAKCDIFIYLDVVQYPRGRSFAARNRIKTPNGTMFLSIPVSIPSGRGGKVKYTEVSFGNKNWKEKHLKTIRMNYSRAPFFEEVCDLYESQLETSESFVALNINLIEAFANYLSIDTKRIRLSDVLSDFGEKTQLVIDICRKVGAKKYLSGTGGGKAYNDEKALKENGIELIYSDFEDPKYRQLWGEFAPNLSVIDLLFNCGPVSKSILLGER